MDETSTERRIRKQEDGQVRYIVVPDQDGAIRDGVWGPSNTVYREDNLFFRLYESGWSEKIVEIPIDCHHPNGDIIWDKVGLVYNEENNGYSVVLIGESSLPA